MSKGALTERGKSFLATLTKHRRERPSDTCRDCKEKAKPGFTRCQYHLTMAKVQRLRRKRRQEKGKLCRRCNSPRLPNRTECRRHLVEANWRAYHKYHGTSHLSNS